MLNLLCIVQPQSWKYTVKYVCSELLENPTSIVADMFNTLADIFGGNLLNKNYLLAIIFIWLVNDYKIT